MKISAKQIGFSKPFNVKPSLKNYRKSNKILIEILKLSAEEERLKNIEPTQDNYADLVLKSLESEDKITADGLMFLKDVFKLSDGQLNHVEESIADPLDFSNYLTYVVQRIKGMSDEEIRLSNRKEAESQRGKDQKK